MKCFGVLLLLAVSAMAYPNSNTRTTSKNTCSGVACWVKIENSDRANLVVAGKEFNGRLLDTYVGRASHLDGRIPGKWVPDHFGGRFYYGYNGQTFELRNNFEVLQYTHGALSWIDATGGNLPMNSIIGGFNPRTQENLYISRGKHAKQLIVGNYLHSTKSATVPWYEFPSLESYEILSLNMLGQMIYNYKEPNSHGR